MKKIFNSFLLLFVPFAMMAQTKYNLLIGTYTQGKSEGIYVYEFNSENGQLQYKNKVKTENPSFLTLSHNKKYLYAVNEVDNGKVTAFKFNPSTGQMDSLNQVSSEGGAPCYIAIDNKDKNVIVGNYFGGNLAVLPVHNNGELGSSIQSIQHTGHGINKERQEKAHVHSTQFSPDYTFLIVNDLGLDRLISYPYNSSDNKPLTENNPPFYQFEGGKGTRHLAFHPNGKFAYTIQELSADVIGFNYKSGVFTPFQTITMLPEGFKGDVGAAEIEISADGKFLYASNRLDINDIVIYSIDQKSGKLTYVGREASSVKTPRSFTIDPSGNFLLVANQGTDDIIVFKRDKKTGLLTKTDNRIEVGTPVYLLFSKK
ncbi:lactonase family protein [Rubrolithibacter danxiaensis]|uniref:lactonase family protein n=1 Tax=Rubrolithibacter danxiaensis TaxID=3390805 RepID=UPI003BF7D3CD